MFDATRASQVGLTGILHTISYSWNNWVILQPVLDRYMVAVSPDTMYVSFIGTKLAKDLLVDVNLLHKPLWQASERNTVCAKLMLCF